MLSIGIAMGAGLRVLNSPVSSVSSQNIIYGRFSWRSASIERLKDRREKVRAFLEIYPYDRRARQSFEDLSTQIDACPGNASGSETGSIWAETVIDDIRPSFATGPTMRRFVGGARCVMDDCGSHPTMVPAHHFAAIEAKFEPADLSTWARSIFQSTTI